MPPSAQETIILDGSHGLETNVSQHSGERLAFRIFRDLVTDVGHRILKRPGRGPTLGAVPSGIEIPALFEYVFVDPANGVETYHTLGAIDGGSFIYRWDGNVTWTAQTLPFAPTQGGRWGFASTGPDNRVFAFNGIDQLLIGEQPSARLVSLTSVMATATGTTFFPHPFVTGDTLTITGATPNAYNGTYVITVTSSTTFTYIFTGGVGAGSGAVIVASALTTVRWRIAGVDAPSFAPTYSLTSHDPPYTTGTLTVHKGNPVVTSTVGANWNGGTMDQKRIVINGNAYTISTIDIGGGGGIPQQLTLTEGFKEVDAVALSYAIYLGIGSWDDIAPQYQFSYVNPASGHVSNPSPLLQVTETFQVDRTITVTIPASAENQAAYQNGYTMIQLFRTPKNAGIMVALREQIANVNSAVTAITYVETATKFADTYLGDFQAPLYNFKPPSGISAMVFQQGRDFAVHRPSGRVRFTPIQGVEVDFGRASESWPPLYKLEIAAPRGLLVVGGKSSADSLVVQTSHGDYSVDGFSSTTFSPYKIETNESGSYYGAATSARGRLFSYYADNKFLMMQEDLAQGIQDRLNLVKPALIAKVRLHWFSANSRNYLLLSVPKGNASTANDYTYVFDLDLGGGPIYEWNFGVTAFATVHDPTTAALQLLAGDAAGNVFRLFSGSFQDAGANFAPAVLTSLFRGDELLEDVKYIKLFVNDPQLTGPVVEERTTLWTGVLYINEQANSGAADGTATALTFRQLGYRYQSAQGRELIWTPTESIRTVSKVFQLALTFPNVNADLWIEKIIIGSDDYQMLGFHPMSGLPAPGGKQA